MADSDLEGRLEAYLMLIEQERERRPSEAMLVDEIIRLRASRPIAKGRGGQRPSQDAINGPWREPDEESIDLYPGLVVHDGRHSGSITVGRSRLPMSAFIFDAVTNGWDMADNAFEISKHYDWDAEKTAKFLHDLLEMRGEFGRLLLVLADAERCENSPGGRYPWWETKRHQKRIGDQLRRCLAVVDPDHRDGEADAGTMDS